jgi:hypothetical protein
MKYQLFVEDNYQQADRYFAGEFETFDEAVVVARKIVDKWLASAHKPGMTASQLYRSYIIAGEDPFIVCDPPVCTFSAWEYAKQRCFEICPQPEETNPGGDL